jgi:hypothetical protein
MSEDTQTDKKPSEATVNIKKMIEKITLNCNDDETPVTYIYRIPKRKNGKKELVTKIVDDSYVEDAHDIGVQYGSGTYQVWINATDENGNNVIEKETFVCGPHYDKLKSEREREEAIQAQNYPQINGLNLPANNPNQSMDVNSLLGIIQDQNSKYNELLLKMAMNQNSSPKTDIAAMLTAIGTVATPIITEFIKSMGKGKSNDNSEMMTYLIKHTMENSQTKVKEMADLFSKGLEIGGIATAAGAEETEGVDMELIRELVPLATTFLNNFTAPLAHKAIRKNPEKVEKLSQPQNYKALVNQLIATHGVEKTQQILKASKLEKKELNPPELIKHSGDARPPSPKPVKQITEIPDDIPESITI